MKIIVLDDYQNVAMRFADWSVLDADIEVVNEHIADDDVLVRRLAGADVVVAMRERTPFGAGLLGKLPDLRLLVTTGMRNAAIDVAAAHALGVVVSGTRGLKAPTAELTWGLVLGLLRHIPAEDAAVRAGGWQHTIGAGLEGKTLGLLGLGELGGRVALIGAAFGMRIVAWSANLTEERATEHGAKLVGKEELLSTADVVSVHLVLGERTRGLLGASELSLMKPSAVLINTSRAGIVDTDALVDALRHKRIGGAALDVYDIEPLPADHPLRTAPRTVLTPHVGYVTEETYRLFFTDAVADIAAYLAGVPVRTLPG